MQNKNSESSRIFNCAMCGFCCHGETTVSLDERDRRRMADSLGMDEPTLVATYLRVTGNITQMRVRDGHCIFYDRNVGCKVHEGRPWRCRQWPLHPSILTDENNFGVIRESCPGVSREMDYEEFCAVLRRLLAEKKQADNDQ